MLIARYQIDYGIYHSCTLDSMGHRFGHDCAQMDLACYKMDAMLAHFLPLWLKPGCEVAITSDHGQSDCGHHGGREDAQQDVAFYWFGGGDGPEQDVVLDQLALAPTLLTLMGADIPRSMDVQPFLSPD